jgi:nitrogen fixation protein FixH
MTMNVSVSEAGGGHSHVTGRTVMVWLLAFFAVVAAVNAVMIGAALSTFAGLEEESPYQEGLMFDREIAAARAQEARHWQVDATVARPGGGTASVAITTRDSDGAALSGLTATVLLAHPTDQRKDHNVDMTEMSPGHFTGTTQADAGQWDAVIELSRAGTRMFRSRNRIVLN